MTRVLITGAAGFVGRSLAATLAARGADVVSFDLNDPEVPGVAAIRGDLGSWAEVFDAVRTVQPDVIYHCGALLSSIAEANTRITQPRRDWQEAPTNRGDASPRSWFPGHAGRRGRFHCAHAKKSLSGGEDRLLRTP